MKASWYNFNKEKILDVKFKGLDKDYLNSYVMLSNPWHSVPILGDNILSLLTDNPKAVVKLDRREQEVINFLKKEDMFSHMIKFCPPKEREYYLTEEGMEEAGFDIFTCHSGAAVIVFLWMGFKNITYESIIPYTNKYLRPNILIEEEIALEQLKYLYGVYFVVLNHTAERHSFVIRFRSNTITIYNSYGGHEGFYITTFERNDWLDKFENFFNKLSYVEQKDAYPYLWGIRSNMIQGVFYEDINFADPVELEDITVSKIF